MADTANITVTGRLTQDGEIRYTNNGTPVLKFGLACNRWKNGGQKTSFYDCEMWGKYGETKAQVAKRGTHCIVSGAIDIDEFEGNNGKVRKIVITVNTLEPSPGQMGDNSNGGGGYSGNSNNGYQSSGKKSGGYTPKSESRMPPAPTFTQFDDDIPF